MPLQEDAGGGRRISRRILSSFKETVLKQEKKKKWLDLWETNSRTAVSAWDSAIVCHLKELENFKYAFWSGLGPQQRFHP